MYLCVDESWQTIEGRKVGSLGAIAIPRRDFADFSREFERVKQRFLTYNSVLDSEFKGARCFGATRFDGPRADPENDHWLLAAAALIAEIERRQYRTFAVATSDPSFSSLRNPNSVALSKPYARLLEHLRAHVRETNKGTEHPDPGLLLLDLRTPAEDRATGRAIENFLTRSKRRWRRDLVQIPEFTISAAHPGLQAADVVSYLGAYQRTPRAELARFTDPLRGLAFTHAGTFLRPTPTPSWEWV